MKRIPFRLSNIDDVPDDIRGVYSFWLHPYCIYVGQAAKQPLKNRLRQHWARTHNDALRQWIVAESERLTFDYQAVRDISKIDETERRLITRYQPLTNKYLVK